MQPDGAMLVTLLVPTTCVPVQVLEAVDRAMRTPEVFPAAVMQTVRWGGATGGSRVPASGSSACAEHTCLVLHLDRAFFQLQHFCRACMRRFTVPDCLLLCLYTLCVLPGLAPSHPPLHTSGHQPYGGHEPPTPPVHAQRGSHGRGWAGSSACGCTHCQVDHQPAGATHTEAGVCVCGGVCLYEGALGLRVQGV